MRAFMMLMVMVLVTASVVSADTVQQPDQHVKMVVMGLVSGIFWGLLMVPLNAIIAGMRNRVSCKQTIIVQVVVLLLGWVSVFSHSLSPIPFIVGNLVGSSLLLWPIYKALRRHVS